MNSDFQNLAMESAKLLALHSCWILLLVFAMSKQFQNTFLKRALWRSSFATLGFLILITFSGLYQWDWLKIHSIKHKPEAPLDSTQQWKPLTLVETPSSSSDTLPVVNISTESLPTNDVLDAPSLSATVCLFWLTGCILLLGLMSFAATAWRWRLRRHTLPASDGLQSVFHQAAKQLNYFKSPILLESPHLNSPLVMGCIRPVIAFPIDHATRYNPTEQHLIMCHEIAHLKEMDGWWQCLANLIAITLWWNPMVWMARQSLRQSAEETADSISTSHNRDGAQLATCLVRIGREMSSTTWTGSLSIFGAGFKSQLGKRVERLLNPHPKMNIQPKAMTVRAIRLLIPFMLIGILTASRSWLISAIPDSASASVHRSVFGMMLFADDLHGANTPLSNTQSPLNDTIPIDASPQTESSTETTRERRLKSIIIPEFSMAVVNGESGFYIEIWENLSKLRKAILDIDPTWQNLTFLLRGNIAQRTLSQLGSSPSTNTMAHVKMGPMKQPNELPAFNPGNPSPKVEDLPESSIDSDSGMVTYFKLTNTSAYDLLMRILHTGDNQIHHVFRPDLVIFDVDHIRTANPEPSRIVKAPEDTPSSPSPSSQLVSSNLRPIKDLPRSDHKPDPAALYTRTFKVNPDTFLERMEAVLGYPQSLEENQPRKDVQVLLHDFLTKIGIEMPDKDQRAMPNQDLKASFFNDRNGMIFVRLTMQDLDILEAALAVLQEPGERNTKVTLDMHIIQLDESGIKVLEAFGFDKPGGESLSQFEHIIDAPTLQRLLLRMNLARGVEVLQSPQITALNGRQSELKAQELRRIVTHNASGNIQTEEVATGPSLSVIPRLLTKDQLELAAHFELLEFLGYDDPGPLGIISQNNNPTSIRSEIIAEADDGSTGSALKKEQLITIKKANLERIQTILKQIESSTESDIVETILQQMPNHKDLSSLVSEQEQLQIEFNNIEGKVALNPKDLNQLKTQKAHLANSIKSWDIRIQQECVDTVSELKFLIKAQQNELNNMSSLELEQQPGMTPSNEILNPHNDSKQMPLTRFKRLELNTKTTLQSGQTLIMGGLKSTETIRWKNSVPVMSKIPLLGGMFRREGISTTEQYIYVLITPIILK